MNQSNNRSNEQSASNLVAALGGCSNEIPQRHLDNEEDSSQLEEEGGSDPDDCEEDDVDDVGNDETTDSRSGH